MSEKTLREMCDDMLRANRDAECSPEGRAYDEGVALVRIYEAVSEALIERVHATGAVDAGEMGRRILAALDAEREAGRGEGYAEGLAQRDEMIAEYVAEAREAGRREALEDVRGWLNSVASHRFMEMFPEAFDHD